VLDRIGFVVVDEIGFAYERPDFRLAALRSGAATHAAQPSAGIVIPVLAIDHKAARDSAAHDAAVVVRD
jgi:hypothetical protein